MVPDGGCYNRAGNGPHPRSIGRRGGTAEDTTDDLALGHHIVVVRAPGAARSLAGMSECERLHRRSVRSRLVWYVLRRIASAACSGVRPRMNIFDQSRAADASLLSTRARTAARHAGSDTGSAAFFSGRSYASLISPWTHHEQGGDHRERRGRPLLRSGRRRGAPLP
jgi:hypothetical protein